LMSHQFHSDHVSSDICSFVDSTRQLYSATFAATTGVDLRFDNHRKAELFHCARDFLSPVYYNAALHRDPILLKKLLPLIFVYFHKNTVSLFVERCCAGWS